MKVSVVLTTYNGMEYIIPLLDSLREQTRRIDEVLIFDDCSKDKTREIISDYIDRYNLFNWRKIWNKENFGWKKNFRIGLQQATGDIVFPCDQDDIWDKNKVEKMSKCMEKNNDILLLSSDYEVIYEEGSRKIEKISRKAEKDILQKICFDEKFYMGKRPGCVMAIKKCLIDMCGDIWLDWYPHDAFLWTVASLKDGCYLYREPLIKYRRHENNVSTFSQYHVKSQTEALNRTINIVDWYKKNNENSEKIEVINKFLVFAELRKELIQDKKAINWIKLIPFRKYYRSTRQQFGDWYYVVKG